MEMQMELSYVFAVVITGLVVVFLGLLLLILFINIIGSIFKSMEKKKKAVPAPAPSKPEVPAAVPAKAAEVVPSDVPEEDDSEIIAVIAAAVAMMSATEGKNYRVRSVRAAAGNYGGNAWASAALRESTRPF